MLDRLHINQIDFKKHKEFWEKGYLYISVIALMFGVYIAIDRVGIYDWQKEIAYFSYIKESITNYHSLPFFWWSKLDNVAWYPAPNHSSNFIGNPETMLFSPFGFLLLFVNSVHYIKIITFIHLLIGIIGLFKLRARLNIDNLEFRTLVVLFMFSPIIIQHLAIGYTPWLNLFFFPLFLYFLLDKKILNSAVWISCILAITLLQGGSHPLFWYILFLIIYSIAYTIVTSNIKVLLRIFLIALFTFLLSFVRLYSTILSYGDFVQPCVRGYNIYNFIFYSLIPPFSRKIFIGKNFFDIFGVPSWDGGIFWGISLFLFLVTLIKYGNYRINLSNSFNIKIGDSLLITSMCLFILSFFTIYEDTIALINSIVKFPFTSIEKYPYRFAIFAYFGFSVVSVLHIKSFYKDLNNFFNEHLSRFFKKRDISILFELIMVISFLIVCSFWFVEGLSNMPDAYPNQSIESPKIVISAGGQILSSNEMDFKVDVSPKDIIISNSSEDSRNIKYILPEIVFRDYRFLSISSDNAAFSNESGHLALVPKDTNPIILTFKESAYMPGVIVSIISWCGVILFSLFMLFVPSKKIQRIS